MIATSEQVSYYQIVAEENGKYFLVTHLFYLDQYLGVVLRQDSHAAVLSDLEDLGHGHSPVAGVRGGPRHHLVDPVILRVQLGWQPGMRW